MRHHPSARATSPFSAAVRGIHTPEGEQPERGKPRALHDEYGAASGPLGMARERSVTPGQGTMRVSQLQESRQESRHRAAFDGRDVEAPHQHAANRPADAAGGGGGGGGRAARAGEERGGHDYRTWLSVLGDEQLLAIRASVLRASDVHMDALPSHQLLEFDSPTAAGHANNWVPEDKLAHAARARARAAALAHPPGSDRLPGRTPSAAGSAAPGARKRARRGRFLRQRMAGGGSPGRRRADEPGQLCRCSRGHSGDAGDGQA